MPTISVGHRAVLVRRQDIVLSEMSALPLRTSESVPPVVAPCVESIDQSGLDYEFGTMEAAGQRS